MNKQTKKQNQTYKHRDKLMVAKGKGSGGMGKMSEGKQKIQASSYRMSNLWGWKVQHRKYSQWYNNHVVW